MSVDEVIAFEVFASGLFALAVFLIGYALGYSAGEPKP